MSCKAFYTIDCNVAIPLILVTEAEMQRGLDSFSAIEKNYFSTHSFSAKLGEYCLIHQNDGTIAKAYIGCGMGQQNLALAYAAMQLPLGTYRADDELSNSAKLNWALAQYRFSDYKTPNWKPRRLLLNSEELPTVLRKAESIFLIRDLINKPANDLGPKELAEVVEKLAKKFDAKFDQWIGEELLSIDCNAIYAVGAAAVQSPRLISLEWGNKNNPHITLIGKGVCFDSGGLDLKPSAAMRLMKKDMGGAAHVIGLANWIMSKNLPVYLQVLIPAVENALGSRSFRPGDILSMKNGLRVEIDNTDAEGRLILADALTKACEGEIPNLLIDFATLTGAARVALGTDIATMFSNNDQLACDLVKVGENLYDPIWRLPLFAGYEEQLNSSVADLVNSSPSPYAGAITAALFLRRFVPNSLNWVHFDIMAWNLCNKPGKPEGGEAMAIRALMHYLEMTYSEGKSPENA